MCGVLVVLVVVVLTGVCVGQAPSPASPHAIIRPKSLDWKPLLPGADCAVLQGNPKQQGLFTIRIRLRAGAEIPPHQHPADENITVLKGKFGIGIGDKFETAAVRNIATGAFVTVPEGVHHFLVSQTESVVQIHGEGPFVFDFVDNQARHPTCSQ